MTRSRIACLAAAFIVASVVSASTQEVPVEGPVKSATVISVESKGATQLDASSLKLEVNGHATPIDSIIPLSRGPVQLAILIDDGLRASFGLQLEDMTKFIQQLPPNVKVLVGYMQNGNIASSGRFTNDHEQLAKQVRIPFSAVGMSASPYFCLSEFVKHWPASEPGARVVLMITNGVDPYNGSVSVLNQDSPYVRDAQEDAQRAGVAVYAIYYGDRAERGGAVSFSGQGYLQQVAQATGGKSFYNGTIPPPSLTPYFNDFAKSLSESYQVVFMANATHENSRTLDRFKLKSTQQGVKLHTPENVHPGWSN
jgi:hypothetical protein